ncbi:MAG: N5-carboxyaminoimidazole ribonucleotide synthase [Pseudomonadota bacterium]|jgi:5-(carboxyamino)imidazole ribonucleotide synthase
MSEIKTILPGQPGAEGQLATLGVMGGGQLGRMFVQAAQEMGYFTAVLDPDPASPAGLVSHFHIQTGYEDEAGLAELAQRCDAITTEFENVPAPALEALAGSRPVAPRAGAVAVAQDRIAEKAHFVACAQAGGVGPAPYAAIESVSDLAAVPAELLPGILKTARLGYDGKGQARVRDRAELAAAWDDMGRVACVLEKMLPLKAELSVIVARGADDQVVHFPVQRNLHRDGILAVTEVHEGNVPAGLAQQAVQTTAEIARQIGYVGVLCVEYFVVDDGSADGALVVNEMAPRPHNSGHYTINACDVSQFELQVRAMAGLPLVQPRLHSPTVMLNLLGDLWFRGAEAVTPPWKQILALPGTHLHLYGKLEARKGRKMGHLNVTGASVEQVQATALRCAELLGMAPWR